MRTETTAAASISVQGHCMTDKVSSRPAIQLLLLRELFRRSEI